MDLSGCWAVLYGTDPGQPDAAGKDRKRDTVREQRHVLQSLSGRRELSDPSGSVLFEHPGYEICDRLCERTLADLSSGDCTDLFWSAEPDELDRDALSFP